MFSTQQSIAAILGLAIVIHTAIGYTGWCLRSQAQAPKRFAVFRMGMQKSNQQKSIYREFLEKFGLPGEESQQRGAVKNIKPTESKTKKNERTALDDIRPGSKHSGRIVSIRRYTCELVHSHVVAHCVTFVFSTFYSNGMFVDIGACRDGFLHIKDCSDKYFIDNLQDRYHVGQNVDVFVKFSDSKLDSLALQLYPLIDMEVNDNVKLDWNDIRVGTRFSGVVVKSSNFGAYVDFGGPVLGFLHRQKMLSNRRQRKLKPWDLCPIGSSQDCYVYRVRPDRRQVELTTYPPDRWEGIFDLYGEELQSDHQSPSHEQFSDEKDSSIPSSSLSESESDENFFLDDAADDDADDDDADDDAYGEDEYTESEEILSPSEIQKLTKYDVIMDDYQDSPMSSDEFEDSDKELLDEGGSVDIDELFKELSEGRPYVTLKDLREWDLIKATIDEGILTRNALKSIFVRSGGVRGKLMQSRFENFVQLFDKEMDAIEQSDDEDHDTAEQLDRDSVVTTASRNDDEESAEESAEDSADHVNILANIFANLAGAKDFVTLDDVLRWDECQRLISEDLATAPMVTELFRDACGGNNVMSFREFMDFREDMEDLSNIEPLFTVEDQLAAMEKLDYTMAISKFEAIDHGKPPRDEGESMDIWNSDDDNEEISDELLEFLDSGVPNDTSETTPYPAETTAGSTPSTNDDSDEALLQEVFADVANGKSFVAVKDILNWDFAIELLAEGIITEWDLEEKVKKYSEKRGMNIHGFDQLLDELMYIYDNHIALHESRDNSEEESSVDPEVNESLTTDDYSEDDGGDVSSDLTNEEDEEAMVLDPIELFNSLSKDGKHVSFEVSCHLDA